ncbi:MULTISPECIES: exosome complex RNA-binding protein Rrp4 [Acidiplasma]|uniref:exosome complex RNA-binding protein Rrp4 n=1 Tax=Acidiplasma TaxID=507753 RepID=UPI0005DD1E77|nr:MULTISPECIES: exosome complex RNA-binding protein Rrp4 [Acidiplasma]KJE48860.1 RNA-binding protein [Acidiplasma sp. MBA-1]WMT54259.1 MAG: exosome complex RNA-binding protein Rrp4 [Acidiplasma sp.]
MKCLETKEIVYPGDKIELNDLKPRNGLYESNSEYFSEYFGVIQRGDKFVDIAPFNSPYLPRVNDKIIGKIMDIGPTMWTVDINSPYYSLLHINDTPWHVNAGDLERYLNVGDFIYAKISQSNEIRESWVSMKEPGMKKLETGQIIAVKPPKVPRVIGKGGNMINLIKNETNTKIIVGQNGFIWIDGDIENVNMAINAIKIVEKEAHTIGLTDRMAEYFKKLKGEN